MDFVDKTLDCVRCGISFVFSAGEQGFYLDKKLQNEPKRCAPCRQAHREEKAAWRTPTEIICAECGTDAIVPFKPHLGLPVFCSDCYVKRPEPAAALV